jgi:hypothetical protein
VREAGATWDEVLGVADDNEPPPPADDTRGRALWALARLRGPNAKEADFLASMAERFGRPTERQSEWLDALVRRAAAGGGR